MLEGELCKGEKKGEGAGEGEGEQNSGSENKQVI